MCTGGEIFAAASIAQGVGGFLRSSDVADQRVERMGQVASSAAQSIRQKAKAQARRRGAQAAAFSKAGVRMTGTAKQVIEEQIAQDELDLLTDKYNAQLQIGAEAQQAEQASMMGISQLASGALQASRSLGLAG